MSEGVQHNSLGSQAQHYQKDAARYGAIYLSQDTASIDVLKLVAKTIFTISSASIAFIASFLKFNYSRITHEIFDSAILSAILFSSSILFGIFFLIMLFFYLKNKSEENINLSEMASKFAEYHQLYEQVIISNAVYPRIYNNEDLAKQRASKNLKTGRESLEQAKYKLGVSKKYHKYSLYFPPFLGLFMVLQVSVFSCGLWMVVVVIRDTFIVGT